MKSGKKVFLITSSLKHGGSERVITELANYFSSVGCDTHLVIINDTPDFYSVSNRVTLHRMGFVNRGKMRSIFSRFRMFFCMRQLMKSNQPDAVLSFITKFNIFTLFSSFFLGLNVYVSDRNNPNAKLPFHYEILRKITYRFAAGIISQTELAKECIFKLTGHKNIVIIPNPIRSVALYPNVARERLIISVGRLVAEKGHVLLLESFSKLNSPGWKLVILGDGVMRDQLVKKIHDLGIGEYVIMPGAVVDVDLWLAKSSIFAFSSISEGFPNALIEAMAAGLPCVSFDCESGPSDIIKSGYNGYLVESGNVDQLTKSIQFVIDNIDDMSDLTRHALKVRQKFNISHVGQDYLEFILPS